MSDALNQTVMTEDQFKAQSEAQQRLLTEMQDVADKTALTQTLSPITATLSVNQPSSTTSQTAPAPVEPMSIQAETKLSTSSADHTTRLETAWKAVGQSSTMDVLVNLEKQVGLPDKAE